MVVVVLRHALCHLFVTHRGHVEADFAAVVETLETLDTNGLMNDWPLISLKRNATSIC